MSIYNPKEIEQKWQKYWEKKGLFKTPKDATRKNKMYILPQLPYPSGSGLHVGHAEVYTACDMYARFQRMKGKKVLQVMGWDSFGLPAENYAIKTNVHPRVSTDKAIDNFRAQIKSLGISVDWDREVGSHNPDYYKWTQWFFLLFYKRGLAYRKKQSVNWCDGCKTVLANEQVTPEGKCERCETVVIQREMEQWFLKITEYADRLAKDLDKVDWPEETKMRQRNWIGRSEGAGIQFNVVDVQNVENDQMQQAKRSNRRSDSAIATISVFTTRPDTLFGATYLVLAPEHPLVASLLEGTRNKKQGTKIQNADEVRKYVEATRKKTELDRQTQKEKTGVELKGITAINPATKKEIPIWIADYVLATYGTGAIMAVPAHDERDFEFAKKFELEIKVVVNDRFGRYLVIEKSLENQKIRRLKDFGGIIVEKETKNWGKFYRVNVPVEKEREFLSFLSANLLETSDDGGSWYADSMGSTNMTVFHGKVVSVFDAYGLSCFKKHGRLEHIPEEQLDIDFKPFTVEGISVNSDFLDGLETPQAKEKIIQWLEKEGVGERKIQYKLRDWSVSRQRFWGAPIPMLMNEKTGELKPVLEKDLPVMLPDDVDFKPTGQSPLNYSKSFNDGVEKEYGKGWKREPDTLDTFMCSSWYYYRYLDPHNNKEFASKENLKTWMPVDFYLGGEEHVNGHLLYARFFTKVLFDAGYINFDEPFLKHRHQGLILGEDSRKMSKRWDNVINPTDVVNEYGADTCRMYEMFMGPLEQTKPWSTDGVKGIRRFLERVWRLQDHLTTSSPNHKNEELDRLVHKTIKKVGEDFEGLKFNTAIAKMMELVNEFYKIETVSKKHFELFVLMLSPFAPHMAEELWASLGHKESIALESWPKYDPKKIVDDMITLAVQVNGKVRANIEVDADITEDEAREKALADEKVQKWLEGKEPKKVIYVKGKLVSIVV